jgi:hypothetical protein
MKKSEQLTLLLAFYDNQHRLSMQRLIPDFLLKLKKAGQYGIQLIQSRPQLFDVISDSEALIMEISRAMGERADIDVNYRYFLGLASKMLPDVERVVTEKYALTKAHALYHFGYFPEDATQYNIVRVLMEERAKAESEEAESEKAQAESEEAESEKAQAESEEAESEKAQAESEEAESEKAQAESEEAESEKAQAESEEAESEKAQAESEEVQEEQPEEQPETDADPNFQAPSSEMTSEFAQEKQVKKRTSKEGKR